MAIYSRGSWYCYLLGRVARKSKVAIRLGSCSSAAASSGLNGSYLVPPVHRALISGTKFEGLPSNGSPLCKDSVSMEALRGAPSPDAGEAGTAGPWVRPLPAFEGRGFGIGWEMFNQVYRACFCF